MLQRLAKLLLLSGGREEVIEKGGFGLLTPFLVRITPFRISKGIDGAVVSHYLAVVP